MAGRTGFNIVIWIQHCDVDLTLGCAYQWCRSSGELILGRAASIELLDVLGANHSGSLICDPYVPTVQLSSLKQCSITIRAQ